MKLTDLFTVPVCDTPEHVRQVESKLAMIKADLMCEMLAVGAFSEPLARPQIDFDPDMYNERRIR